MARLPVRANLRKMLFFGWVWCLVTAGVTSQRMPVSGVRARARQRLLGTRNECRLTLRFEPNNLHHLPRVAKRKKGGGLSHIPCATPGAASWSWTVAAPEGGARRQLRGGSPRSMTRWTIRSG